MKNEPILIMLNGPPQVGKTTGRDYLCDNYEPSFPFNLSTELKKRTHCLFDINKHPDYYERMKDVPHSDFLGLTPRQAYIWVSEEVMKPKFGKDIWGKFLAKEISKRLSKFYKERGVFIVGDLGFEEEIYPLFKVIPPKQSLIIRVHQEDKDFSHDSRSYLYLEACKCVDIDNPEGNVLEFKRSLIEAIGDFVDEIS